MRIKLGELLIQQKLVTKAQVEEALHEQKQFGGKLGTNLVELGFISDERLAQVLSKQLNLPTVHAADFDRIPASVIQCIPKDEVQKHKMVPIKLDKRITLAICDPQTALHLDELSFTMGKTIQAVIAPEIWVIAAMERYYQIPREARFVQLDDMGASFLSRGQPILGSEIVLEQHKAVVFKSYIERLLKSETKEDTIQCLLDFLHSYYTRTAVYVLRKDALHGWILRGFPLHMKEFQSVVAPLSTDTSFKDVLETLEPYVGSLVVKPGNQSFVSLLNIPPEKKVELHALSFHGKGVIVILGMVDEGISVEDRRDLLELAFKKASMALELLSLKRSIAEVSNV